MLPNPQIGAPAAPSSPQSLSFQSDPSQRAQFKGFMNNLSAQPAPIPAPVTVPAANVDIFSSMMPVQGFADGGYAEAAYGGESNYGDVSYGNFDNGSGYDDPGDDVMDIGYSAGQVDPGLAMAARGQGRSNFTAGPAPTAEDSSLDQAIFNTLAATNQQNVNTIMSQPDVMSSRADLQRGLDSRQNTATAGDALGRQMAAIEARSPIESSVDARTQPTSATLLNIDMFGDTYSGNLTPGQRDDLLGMQEKVGQLQRTLDGMKSPSAADDSYDPYQSIKNLAEFSKMKSAIDSEYMGTPAPRPQRTFVSPDIPVMSDAERADMERADAGPNMSMASPYDMISPQIPPQVGELGAMGAGAFSEGTVPVVNMPSLQEERVQKAIMDAAGRTTDVKLGSPATTMTSLDQLARRAGGAGINSMRGIGAFGARMAASMYDDIVNKGYIPEYDSRGQIIRTRNPKTGVLGKGSRPEASIDDGDDISPIRFPTETAAPKSEAEEVANILGGLAQEAQEPTTATPAAPSGPTPLGMPLQFGYGQVSSNLNNALSNFFNLLGGK